MITHILYVIIQYRDYMRNNVKLHEYLRKKGLQNHIPKNLIPEEAEEDL